MKPMWCIFHSIYWELRAFTCFEHYLLISRRRCTVYCVCIMSVGCAKPTDIIHKVKGKANPLQALTCPVGSRRLRLPDFKTISTWRWQDCQPYAPAAFTPRNIPGTHFCYRLSQPQGHSAAGRIMSMKNSINTIGNRSRDLPACSVVPQPPHHRVPQLYKAIYQIPFV
jgi:hypothetical protein